MHTGQVWHTDFEVNISRGWFSSGSAEDWDPASMPATCMLALEGNSVDFVPYSYQADVAKSFIEQLPSTSGKTEVYSVRIDPGDIIVWRGDIYHRGSASSSRDARLLWHVYSPSMKMVDNLLYSTVQKIRS